MFNLVPIIWIKKLQKKHFRFVSRKTLEFDFTDVQASTKGKTFFEKLVKNISVMMFGVYF